jgi:hypothetical protein
MAQGVDDTAGSGLALSRLRAIVSLSLDACGYHVVNDVVIQYDDSLTCSINTYGTRRRRRSEP